MIEKLNYLEGGHETPKATHQLASALLTQLTTSGMQERFGLSLSASDALRRRTIAVMTQSTSRDANRV